MWCYCENFANTNQCLQIKTLSESSLFKDKTFCWRQQNDQEGNSYQTSSSFCERTEFKVEFSHNRNESVRKPVNESISFVLSTLKTEFF